MSIESPENPKQISENEWQKLKEDAAYWEGRIGENKTPSKSYAHILYNLNTGLAGSLMFNKYEPAVEDIGLIKRYFHLLDEHPDFAEKELVPGEGYFSIDSTMADLGTSLCEPLIEEYEKRLASEKKE